MTIETIETKMFAKNSLIPFVTIFRMPFQSNLCILNFKGLLLFLRKKIRGKTPPMNCPAIVPIPAPTIPIFAPAISAASKMMLVIPARRVTPNPNPGLSAAIRKDWKRFWKLKKVTPAINIWP